MQDGDKQNVKQAEEPAQDQPEVSPPPDSPWQFKSESSTQTTQVPATHEAVSWTASEFIAHEKAASWYLILAGAAILLAAFIYLLTRDVISVVVVAIFAAVFGFFAARKPRVLTYSLDDGGIHISEKFYSYSDFKSFSVLDEGGISGIWLMPLKRFMPSLTIYYAPDDEKKIMDALSSYLPFEERDHDMVDRLMRRVRF